MPTPVANYVQQLDLPNLVELFEITFQGTTSYWTNGLMADTVYWNNQAFGSLPLQITGIEYNETNNSESPKLQISNVANRLGVLLTVIPNLKGATLNYIRTFDTYTGATAPESSSLFLFKRHLTIDKLLSKTAEHIVYECGTMTSWKERVFPRRQLLRDGLPKMRFEGLGINKQR